MSFAHTLKATAGAAVALAIAMGVLHAREPGLDRAAIDRYVEAYRYRNRLPGVAVAITRHREIVHVAGYGHDSTGAAITAGTRLPIASLSKSFTSLAVMQLVEAGRVNLDAPVRDYLPELSVADSRGETVTVRHLLTHTSGLSDQTFHEKSGPIPSSLRDGVAMLRTARLISSPGAKAHYHNPNYWVAARLVEVVSGMSFAEYLQRRIFEPLGMRASTTSGTLENSPGLARGHVRFFGAPLALPEPAWFLDGASGIVTTADDLAQWLILQSNAGESARGTRLISAAGLRAMHGGLAWSVRGDGASRTVEHSGWLFTFTAHQMLLPDSGYGIAVISNTGLGLAPVDSEVIARALAAMVDGQTPEPGAPVGVIVDIVLLGLVLLSAGLGVRGLKGAPDWAARRAGRPVWRNTLALVPRLLPAALLVALPATLSVVFGGRDASYLQILYVAPSLIACLLIATAFGVGVAMARGVQLHRSR